MESTEPVASAPMGLWEFARHIRTITVMGTTVRLAVPTDHTERGASDLTGLRSFGGHIRGDNPAAAASKEPKLGKEMAVVAVRMSGLIRAAGQPGPRSKSWKSLAEKPSRFALVAYWERQIDTAELCQMLEPLPAHQTMP
jgi:hypothetical protein